MIFRTVAAFCLSIIFPSILTQNGTREILCCQYRLLTLLGATTSLLYNPVLYTTGAVAIFTNTVVALELAHCCSSQHHQNQAYCYCSSVQYTRHCSSLSYYIISVPLKSSFLLSCRAFLYNARGGRSSARVCFLRMRKSMLELREVLQLWSVLLCYFSSQLSSQYTSSNISISFAFIAYLFYCLSFFAVIPLHPKV